MRHEISDRSDDGSRYRGIYSGGCNAAAITGDEMNPEDGYRVSAQGRQSILKMHPRMQSLLNHSYRNIREGKALQDEAGFHSALTIGIDDERINGGRPTLIPSVWNGDIVSEKKAKDFAVAAGDIWPEFKDHGQSDQMSQIASAMMGEVFDPEGAGYDYQSAYKAGLKPTDGHWPSRDPSSGLLLKGRAHPTWDKLEQGEAAAGMEIYRKDGRYRSKPKKK